jgi:CHAD domain-containing protein
MLKVDTARSRRSAADALMPLWRRSVADLRAGEAEVRLGDDEGVHRFRVAARRLRSNLAGLRPLLDPLVVDGLQRGLREAAAVVGDARDAEVVRRRVDLLLRDEPDGPALDRVRERLAGVLTDSSATGRSNALEYFDARPYDELTRSLDRFSDIAPWTPASRAPAEEALAPLLLKEWNRFRRRGRSALDASGDATDEELHEARKAAKRARYLAEALHPVFGRRAKQLAQAAERVQVALGEYQDSAVTRSLLEDVSTRTPADGDDAATLRRMLQTEQRAAREARSAFQRRFAEADRKSLRRWLD